MELNFAVKKIFEMTGMQYTYNLTHMDGATKISELLNSYFCSESSSFPVFFVDQAQEEGVGDKTNKHLTLSLLID